MGVPQYFRVKKIADIFTYDEIDLLKKFKKKKT